MPERIDGAIELWDGWRLALPNPCMAQRNADGSWSAWDAVHTIDVHIVTVTHTRDSVDLSAEAMLGATPTHRGNGWIGVVGEIAEADEQGPAFRRTLTAAANATFLSCWIAYRDRDERTWADRLIASVEYVATGA